MSGKALVDTNVLVYAYDRSEPAKQARALEVLGQLDECRAGILSSQGLGELFVTLTRKIAALLSVCEAYERVAHYVGSWPVLAVTGPISLEAARGVRDHQLGYWDAQLWATARLNQIGVVPELRSHSGRRTLRESIRTRLRLVPHQRTLAEPRAHA